jgi:hypothetical protein
MKAILRYNLNDPDDAMAYKRANKSLDMAMALWEIIFNVYKQTERGFSEDEKTNDIQYETLEKVFEKIREILNDNEINIENLIN